MKDKTKNVFNHILTILLGIAIVVFIWTLAISIPIYSRSFYYGEIDRYKIDETSGFDKQTIIKAYDDVLDFLTFHKEFKTGDLNYSEEGKAHFVDCQRLFDLNIILLAVSFVIIAIITILALCKKIELKKYGKFNIWFYSGVVAIVLPLIVLIFALIDFEQAFIAFHSVLFPGKTNWMFDSTTDEIIRILPEQFFADCAIMIGITIFILTLTLIIAEIIRRIRGSKLKVKNEEVKQKEPSS